MRFRRLQPGQRDISLLEPLPAPLPRVAEGRHRRTRYFGGHRDAGFYNTLVIVVMWPAVVFAVIIIAVTAVLSVIGVPLGWGW
jgi:hypothetical protein